LTQPVHIFYNNFIRAWPVLTSIDLSSREEKMRAFSEPAKQRKEAIQKHKERGGQVAAVLPIHYPRALLRAFNYLPVEVWGPPQIINRPSAAHLQPYICSIAHNALSFLLTGGLEPADLILAPHTCDSLQGLGSIILDFVKPRQAVLTLYIPRGGEPESLEYLAREIQSLYNQLELLTGCSPSMADLAESIHREEAADRALSELYQQRLVLPLDSPAFYRLIRSREYLPAEVFESAARDVLSVAAESAQQGGTPILLSGIVPEPMAVLEAITTAGGYIAGDDLACCGRRLYPPGASPAPFTRMAESLLHAPADPTRGSPIQERFEWLLDMAHRTGARGVVFYEIKFCEPELFDLPVLRKKLMKSGVRSTVIEIDLNDGLTQQNLTRLEAFLEALQ
jgi:benzoyl-CoA reductase/2-hydroxyglutaryl-CoA dehydratase subunit BcrC/BadD/HgdB